MPWLPGWNSIEAAGWWSNFYFWFGIGALALLGASEVVAHRYGLRKDELVAIAEQNTKAQNDQQSATLRQQVIDAKAAAEAAKKDAELVSQPRRLSAEQRAKLIAAISHGPKGRLVIQTNGSVDDARDYGEEIAAVLRTQGWEVTVPNTIMTGTNLKRSWFTVRDPKNVSPAAMVFINAFSNSGIPMRTPPGEYDPSLPADVDVVLKIGSKL